MSSEQWLMVIVLWIIAVVMLLVNFYFLKMSRRTTPGNTEFGMAYLLSFLLMIFNVFFLLLIPYSPVKQIYRVTSSAVDQIYEGLGKKDGNGKTKKKAPSPKPSAAWRKTDPNGYVEIQGNFLARGVKPLPAGWWVSVTQDKKSNKQVTEKFRRALDPAAPAWVFFEPDLTILKGEKSFGTVPLEGWIGFKKPK